MGSLYSKPKATTYSAPVTSVVSTPSTPAATVQTSQSAADTSGTDTQKAVSIVRKKSPTILTSYKGVLSEAEWVPARKSLLGE